MLSSLDGRRPFTSTLLEGSGGKVYGDMVVISVRIYSRWFRNIPFFVSLDGKLMKCAVDGRAPEPVIVSEIGTGTIMTIMTIWGGPNGRRSGSAASWRIRLSLRWFALM